MIANTLVASSITEDFDGLPSDFAQQQWSTSFAHTVMSHNKQLNTVGAKLTQLHYHYEVASSSVPHITHIYQS